jgi:pimeloyl-ACP methyl ester carboxylesterase
VIADPVGDPNPRVTSDALAADPAIGMPCSCCMATRSREQWKHRPRWPARGNAGSRSTGAAARAVEVGAYGPEALHGGVLVVADALGWPRLDLLGHWLASAVAWMKAAAHPERPRTLITVSTPHGTECVDPRASRQSLSIGGLGVVELFRTPGAAERALRDDALRLLSPHTGSNATSRRFSLRRAR